jgi:hypothetical protein
MNTTTTAAKASPAPITATAMSLSSIPGRNISEDCRPRKRALPTPDFMGSRSNSWQETLHGQSPPEGVGSRATNGWRRAHPAGSDGWRYGSPSGAAGAPAPRPPPHLRARSNRSRRWSERGRGHLRSRDHQCVYETVNGGCRARSSACRCRTASGRARARRTRWSRRPACWCRAESYTTGSGGACPRRRSGSCATSGSDA